MNDLSNFEVIYRETALYSGMRPVLSRVNGEMKCKLKLSVCGRCQLLSRGLVGRYSWRPPGLVELGP